MNTKLYKTDTPNKLKNKFSSLRIAKYLILNPMSSQNLDELFDTLMQNFIDSVPLVPTNNPRPRSQNEANVNESVINNMFNIRRNLQYNSTRTSSRNRAYIPNNGSVTLHNGRISDHQNISSNNLDMLRTIFNPNGSGSDWNVNVPSMYGSNRSHTDHTTTTTTTTTTRVNGQTTHTHTSTTHRNNESSSEQSTQSTENDTEISDMLSNMTSTIFSSLFGGQALWLDEINQRYGFTENDIPLQDVKVTLSNEQFNKLQRVPIDKCDNQTCHVCMEEFDQKESKSDAIKLSCSHIFHQHCIKRWLCKEKVTCPVCRADVRESL